MIKWVKRLGCIVLTTGLAIQLVPVGGRNPPTDPKLVLHPPAEVEAILRNSCYDCHSNETRWPWYTYVAPVSWAIASHVHEGRKNMNFSEWGELTPAQQSDTLGDIYTQVSTGQMPLSSYLKIHDQAQLTPAQIKIIGDWTDAAMKALEAKIEADSPAPPATTPPKS